MIAIKLLGQKSGAILVLFAIVLFVLLAMAALSIDIGQAYIARQRAQNICDAAVLAGIAMMDPGQTGSSQTVATARAQDCALSNNEREHWKIYQLDLQTEGVTVTFPDAETIRADGKVKANYAFAGIFNQKTGMIPAHSVARIASISKLSYNMVPLCVADTAVGQLEFGENQVLKTDKWQQGQDVYVGAGNFGIISYEGDSGAADYRARLAGTLDDPVTIAVGDYVDTKPGNSVGPTDKGLTTRVQSDQVFTDNTTAWSEWIETYDPDNMSFTSTPRIIVMPVVADPGGSLNGQTQLEVVGFAAFFIESETYVKYKDETGHWVEEVQVAGRFISAGLYGDALRWLSWMSSGTQSGTVYKYRLIE